MHILLTFGAVGGLIGGLICMTAVFDNPAPLRVYDDPGERERSVAFLALAGAVLIGGAVVCLKLQS